MAFTKYERLSLKFVLTGALALLMVTAMTLLSVVSAGKPVSEAFDRWGWACLLIILFTALLAAIPILFEDQRDLMATEGRIRARRRAFKNRL